MLLRAAHAVFCAWLISGLAGCAQWSMTESEPSTLPPARMSPDSVSLEIAFVRLPAADEAGYEAIWSEADETHFPPELRKQLSANGLRAGLLGQQLPDELRAALDEAANVLEERAEDVSTSDVEVNRAHRRLTCRTGRRAKIIVSKTHPSLPLLQNDNGQISGQVLADAQCLLALKPYPQGDGRVKLDITPEIEHGEMKTQWVGQEGSLMQRIGRDRLILDRLRLEAMLSLGQVLMISAGDDVKGAGEHFFTETAGGRTERTVVLIRVARTQWDDLFAPEQISAPLATPGE